MEFPSVRRTSALGRGQMNPWTVDHEALCDPQSYVRVCLMLIISSRGEILTPSIAEQSCLLQQRSSLSLFFRSACAYHACSGEKYDEPSPAIYRNKSERKWVCAEPGSKGEFPGR